MTELITHSGAWSLLQQAATLPDTVVTVSTRGWFETVAGIASSVMSITLVVLTIVVAPAAWDFYKTFKKARELLDKVQGDVQPLIHNAGIVAENLREITTAIRANVGEISGTISAANHRLNEAMMATETRIREFNALMHVAQQEAEQAFVSTASVVRGVRSGAAAFHDADDEVADEGGEDDGDDGESYDDNPDTGLERADGARVAPARPRLKARRRRG